MDQDTLFQLLQALQGKQWYAAVGLGLMVLIAFARVIAPAVWSKIPERIQWLPAVLGAGAVAVVDAWQSGIAWQQALVLAVYAMVTGAGVAIGGWHTVKRMVGGKDSVSSVTISSDGTVKLDGKVKLGNVERNAEPVSVAKPYEPTDKHAASDPPPADGAA